MVLSQMASTTARPQSSCRCCRSHPPARREGEDGLSYKDDGPCEHCSWYTPAPHLPTGLQPPHIIRYVLCNGVMMPLCYLQPPAPPPPPPPPPHYRDFVDLPTLPVRRIHPDYIMPRHVERVPRGGFQQPAPRVPKDGAGYLRGDAPRAMDGGRRRPGSSAAARTPSRNAEGDRRESVHIYGGRIYDEGILHRDDESAFPHGRYREVAPRAVPRQETPASIPAPMITELRDFDGRTFGEYAEVLRWPAAVAPSTASEPPTVLPDHGRRYDGVQSGFYDAILPRTPQWLGAFGGPFVKEKPKKRPKHPWDGNEGR